MITPERLRLYPRAVFVALVLAFVFAVVSADDLRLPGGGRLGSDYPAFHAAGVLAREGRGASLYDTETLAATQSALFPDTPPGTFLAFPYPAMVALPYAALAGLGFRWAYAVHTVIAGLAVWLAADLVCRWLPALRPHRFVTFVTLLSFYPLLRAVLGGQNTAFSLFVLAAAAVAEDRARPVLQGVVAALLICKPQLGVPLLALQALRRPRTLLGALPTTVLLLAMGTAVAGRGWVFPWIRSLPAFAGASTAADATNDVSLVGLARGALGVPEVGLVACVFVAVGLVMPWRSHTVDPPLRWALTAVALPWLPPHSLFYDMGLAGLALVVLAASGAVRSAVVGWVAGLAGTFGGVVGLQPLVLLPGLVGALLVRRRSADVRSEAVP